MASNIDPRIDSLVRSFVGDLEVLLRRAALEAVDEVLRSGAVQLPSAPKKALAPKASGPARKGGKRDPLVIAKLTDAVGAYVKASPGQGVEAIAKGLGVRSGEITLPIAKLLASGALKKTGEKRATRYFPG